MTNLGGEFGIGGLFNVANSKIQDKIYEKWEKFSPALKSALGLLQGHHQQPPILHAAILAKAPLHVILNIITQFEYSVLQTDSLNRCALAVGFKGFVCSNSSYTAEIQKYLHSCTIWP